MGKFLGGFYEEERNEIKRMQEEFKEDIMKRMGEICPELTRDAINRYPQCSRYLW